SGKLECVRHRVNPCPLTSRCTARRAGCRAGRAARSAAARAAGEPSTAPAAATVATPPDPDGAGGGRPRAAPTRRRGREEPARAPAHDPYHRPDDVQTQEQMHVQITAGRRRSGTPTLTSATPDDRASPTSATVRGRRRRPLEYVAGPVLEPGSSLVGGLGEVE